MSQVARDWQATKSCTRAKHAEKLKHHASWSTTRQKVQAGHLVTSRLELVAQSSCEAKPLASFVLEKLTLCIPNTHQYKYPLYPRNIKSFQKYFFREKLQRKTRLFHPQSSHRDSSNSSTLTISIITSLRGSLPNHFLTIPTSVRRLFGALESS